MNKTHTLHSTNFSEEENLTQENNYNKNKMRFSFVLLHSINGILIVYAQVNGNIQIYIVSPAITLKVLYE